MGWVCSSAVAAHEPLDGPRSDEGGDPAGGAAASAPDRAPWALVLGALAVLAVPLVVALAGFRRAPWTPVLDLAMTELRVRDVGGRHTPLIGLPGRIGPLSEQGSHPGPLSFYALAPTYRLLGSNAWALQVATALVHLVGLAVALLVARRRGGPVLVLATGAGLAVLTAGYGGGTLTEPWNPYLPLVWWVVVLLAAWSVLRGDLPMLPVLVLGASFCAQTHVPYLLLCLGMGALAAAGAVWWWRGDRERRGQVVRWVGVSLALGLALWLPPTVDQIRRDPGNYRTLIEHFTSPEEDAVGLSGAVEESLLYFDAPHVVRGDVVDPGWMVTRDDTRHPTPIRGGLVLLAWAGAAAVALRRGSPGLRALHAVVGAGLLLMVFSISRIFGVVWYYLTLWGWAVGLLAVAATLATLAEVLAPRFAARREQACRGATVALVVVGVLAAGRFAVDAWDSPHADAPVAAQLAAAVDDVAAGLEAQAGLATGHDGRYLITWSDPLHIGSQGFGLLSELERRGFEVGVEAARRVPATAHRVLAPADATARIHLATGTLVERWRQVPGAVEVALVDERTTDERAEQERLRSEVEGTLRDLGLDELIPELDANLFGTAIDPRIPERTQQQLGRILDIGGPLAVFVAPVDAPPL